MSRTRANTSGSSNPAAKYLEWDTQQSAWEYWDKDNKESKTLPKETAFIVLDQLNTAKGWDDRKGGMWSNEVRTVKDELIVKCKEGVITSGTWAEVKSVNGIKFTKSVYAMAKVGEVYELVNFQLKGCSLTAWIEFQDSAGCSLEGDIVVSVKEAEAKKKGAVRFNSPVFSIISKTLSPEAATQADELDGVLQKHLDQYFGGEEAPQTAPEPVDVSNVTEADMTGEVEEPMPF